MDLRIRGNIVDIENRSIYQGDIEIINKIIHKITWLNEHPDPALPYIIPGFVDAHVHIESSMLVPAGFARLAVTHGTVATVSDPHEIANVCGVPGIEFMIENGKTVPFKFFFGAPSCVPATKFETAGADVTVDDVERLLERGDIFYLSEMMNFPGVLNADPEVMAKIAAAQRHNKPIDGHAPGLRGAEAERYIAAGISTDHECFTREEALEKITRGMKILIREGSAAKNFDELIPLLGEYPDSVLFCSDDKHPDSLAEGHVNQLCRRALAAGHDVFKILKAACVNPVKHYRLPVGLLKEGDAADLVLLSDLREFNVLKTYIGGTLVAENGRSLIDAGTTGTINRFGCSPVAASSFSVSCRDRNGREQEFDVIEALDGQLITGKLKVWLPVENGIVKSDINRDLLKIAVVNRYCDAPVALSFVKNFGIKKGAIASSVAHDSHNIVVVGADDESMAAAVNLVISSQGGISCVNGRNDFLLPLPVAGLMSTDDGYLVAEKYTAIDKAAKSLGCTLSSPFMTLSFMALLVIPHLKLSDKGLFDVDTFSFTEDRPK